MPFPFFALCCGLIRACLLPDYFGILSLSAWAFASSAYATEGIVNGIFGAFACLIDIIVPVK